MVLLREKTQDGHIHTYMWWLILITSLTAWRGVEEIGEPYPECVYVRVHMCV